MDKATVTNQHFLSPSYARILFRYLKLTKANSQPFFRGSHVDYNQLMELNTELSFEQQIVLFENALTISESPELGLLVGTQLHLSTHGSLGAAIFSSENLRVALDTLTRFFKVRAQFIDIQVHCSGKLTHIQLNEPFSLGELRCFLSESLVSAIYSAISFFTASAELKGELRFAYGAPDYHDRYLDFFNLPISFDQNVTEIIVESTVLELSSSVADKGLHKQVVERCQQLLQELQPQTVSYSESVRSIFANNPGKIWGIEEVAKQLNMTSRTLIRKLKVEDTRFQKIRDSVLQQQAKAYLMDRNMTVENIGHLLGFSEAASFRRSFKRWFGETPANFRHTTLQ